MGENAIKLEDDKYYGHGAGVTTAEGIINILNRNRIPGSHTSAYLTDTVVAPDFRQMEQLAASVGEGMPPVYSRPAIIAGRVGAARYRRILDY
jgi:protein-glutamine gamma-glutamyltransferase